MQESIDQLPVATSSLLIFVGCAQEAWNEHLYAGALQVEANYMLLNES